MLTEARAAQCVQWGKSGQRWAQQSNRLGGKFEHGVARRYCRGDHPPQPRRDIKSFWLNYCEDEWQRAFFMFSSSKLFLLLFSIGRICPLFETQTMQLLSGT